MPERVFAPRAVMVARVKYVPIIGLKNEISIDGMIISSAFLGIIIYSQVFTPEI